MKVSGRITTGIAVIGLAFAGAVFAHPGGQQGRAMGHGGMHGMGHQMMGQCAGQAGADNATCTGMGAGGMHGQRSGAGEGGAAAQSLMSAEERQALRDKMRSAKTPDERQRLAQENRATMEQRAKERGITLPAQRGPMMGHRMGSMGPGAAPHDSSTH